MLPHLNVVIFKSENILQCLFISYFKQMDNKEQPVKSDLLDQMSFCGTGVNSHWGPGSIVMLKRWQETSCRQSLISALAHYWLPFISLSPVPSPLITDITANFQLIISFAFLLNFSLCRWRCHLGFELALIRV